MHIEKYPDLLSLTLNRFFINASYLLGLFKKIDNGPVAQMNINHTLWVRIPHRGEEKYRWWHKGTHKSLSQNAFTAPPRIGARGILRLLLNVALLRDARIIRSIVRAPGSCTCRGSSSLGSPGKLILKARCIPFVPNNRTTLINASLSALWAPSSISHTGKITSQTTLPSRCVCVLYY